MNSDPFAAATRRLRWKARLGRWRRTLLRPIRPSRLAPGRPGPGNLVLIGVDTLRADHLGLGGYDRPTSPRLDRFAAQGTVFTDVTAPAPWTLPSFSSALTGVMPGLHGGFLGGDVRNMDTQPPGRLHDDVVTLATHLRGQGYRCAAFYSNQFFAFGLAESFDEHHYHNLPAGDLADLALDWIRRHADGPFFCFVLMNDPHEPTTPPRADLAPFLPDLQQSGIEVTDALLRSYMRWGEAPGVDLGRISGPTGDANDPSARAAVALKLAIYDATIRQVDRAIGDLYDQLHTRRLADRTVCSVFSDHGEEFLDHVTASHAWNHDPRGIHGIGHGHTQFQELLHVPWLAWGPGVPAGVRRRDAVTLLDLSPTLLKWLGLPPMDQPRVGRVATAVPPHLGESLVGRSVVVETEASGTGSSGGGDSSADPATTNSPHPDRLILCEALAYGPDIVALRRGRWKLIAHRDGRVLGLFNLLSDPGEITDVQAVNAAVVDEMLELLAAWRDSGLGAAATGAPGGPAGSPGETGNGGQPKSWNDLDETVRQRLKDLGYSD